MPGSHADGAGYQKKYTLEGKKRYGTVRHYRSKRVGNSTRVYPINLGTMGSANFEKVG